MTRVPDLPWQLWPFLAVAALCFLAGWFVCLVAVGRTLRARRRQRAHGGVIDLTGASASLREPWDWPEPPPLRSEDAA